jgi:hypothetical protein
MKFIVQILIFFVSFLLASIAQTSWAKNTTIYTGLPYYIDSKNILYFNISNTATGIIAVQLDLGQIFPYISTEILKQKTYQFEKNQIQIVSYQGPPIRINFTLVPENNEIQKASYHLFFKGQERTLLKPLELKSRSISFETLEQFEQNFNMNAQDWLKNDLSTNPYMLNTLMFSAAINHFDDMNEFMQNLIKNLIQNHDISNYEKAKTLYLQYLTESTEFQDIDLIMAATEHADLNFLEKMRLRQLNQIVIDEVEPRTYYYTMCTPLGRAMRLNQYQIVEFLLKRGASTDLVCISKLNTKQSAINIAEQYKNKRMLKLIGSYMNKKSILK